MSSYGLIGDLLLHAGVVDAAGLDRALLMQAAQPVTLGRALASLGLADESQVAAAIAAGLHLEFLTREPPAADAAVSALLSEEFCRKHRIVPLGLTGKALQLAVTDPMDYGALQDVEFRTGKRTVAVVVTQTWLEHRFGPAVPRRVGPDGELRHARTPRTCRTRSRPQRRRVRPGRSGGARQGRASCRRSSSWSI